MRTSKGKRKKYEVDHVVNSKSDNDMPEVAKLASEYIGIVSVRSTLPHEVNLEISEARAVGYHPAYLLGSITSNSLNCAKIDTD